MTNNSIQDERIKFFYGKENVFFDPTSGKEIREHFLKLIKQDYLNEVKSMYLSDDEQRFFSWLSGPAKIHVIFVQSPDKRFSELISFARKARIDEPNDSIVADVLTISEKDSYQFFQKWTSDTKLKYVVTKINDCPELTISNSSDSVLPGFSAKKNYWLLYDMGSRWAKKEYNAAKSNVKKTGFELEASLLKFNDSGLHANKYALQEIIDTINNPQFVEELSECLKAYELPLFYVCAAGLGGIIESILSFSIGQYHIKRKDLPKDPTAYDYLQALSRNGLIGERQLKYLQSTFMLRNSVSHYNTGAVTSELCDRMMNTIQAIFKSIFLPSKEWDEKYGKPNLTFENWRKHSNEEAEEWFKTHDNPFPHIG